MNEEVTLSLSYTTVRYSITVKISRAGDRKVIEVMTSTESLAI